MISRSSNPENGNSSSDGANHNSGGDEGDGSHRDRDGRFPLAIPQAGHRVNRSKGSGKGSADDPSAAQSGSEKEHSDYPNSFHTVNDGSKQPFRRSATAAAKQNSDRFTASLEETTSQKELGVARKRKSSFCSSTTSEFPPDEIWATSKPSSVGAALPGSPPPAPHNWSLQALNNEAVSTMPPIMRVFAGNVEQQQPMSSELLVDIMMCVVGPSGDHYRAAGGYNLCASHYCRPSEVQEIPELSPDAPECRVLTPSDVEGLSSLGVRVKDLLVILRELGNVPCEDRPRQLILGILMRVCKLACLVLQAGGRICMQLMDGLQIRVDTCTVLVQADVLASVLPPNTTDCSIPTCGPVLPETTLSSHTPGTSSLHRFVQLLLIRSGLYQDVKLGKELFRSLFPTRLTVCAAHKE